MEKSISSDLIRGHIDTIILHTLLSGDKFAQQISDEIETKSNNQYQINQATLYSSLKRLETQKYIIGYWHDTENGRRRNYKITEAGENFVNANLSNWSFSRAIIDKLIDYSPEPEKAVEIKYVEKIVEVPVEKPVIVTNVSENSNSEFNTETENSENTIKSNVSSVDNTKEINFRYILNGLVKSNNLKKRSEPENLEPITLENTAEPIKNEPEADVSFSESISRPDFTKVHNIKSQIDFGDLSLKAKEEGFKLRISSKDTKIKGSVLRNKLNFVSSLIVFALSIVEFIIFALSSGSLLQLNALKTVVTILILMVFPVVMTIIYIKDPRKTCNEIKGDSILIALVVVFNLILFTFVFDLLLSVKLSDIYSLITAFIIPMIVYLDALIFFILRFYLSDKSKFKIKND